MSVQHPLEALSFFPLKSTHPNILLYRPESQSAPPRLPSPGIVILTTWLGGSTPSRIAVYCREYQKLYPATPILLIRTTLTEFRTKTLLDAKRQLAPARDFLLKFFAERTEATSTTGSSKGALLHIFSNGGLNTAVSLSNVLRGSNAVPRALPIPIIGIILDSCPGNITFTRTYNAAVLSLPQSQPVNTIGRVVLYPYVWLFAVLQRLGISSFIDTLRDSLNSVATFGPGPRLYMHSLTDQVMAPRDVISHAEAAKAKGFTVRHELWDDAAHCALPVSDSLRYWNAIESFVAGEVHKRTSKL